MVASRPAPCSDWARLPLALEAAALAAPVREPVLLCVPPARRRVPGPPEAVPAGASACLAARGAPCFTARQ